MKKLLDEMLGCGWDNIPCQHKVYHTKDKYYVCDILNTDVCLWDKLYILGWHAEQCEKNKKYEKF